MIYTEQLLSCDMVIRSETEEDRRRVQIFWESLIRKWIKKAEERSSNQSAVNFNSEESPQYKLIVIYNSSVVEEEGLNSSLW